jgi:hypothetical protein
VIGSDGARGSLDAFGVAPRATDANEEEERPAWVRLAGTTPGLGAPAITGLDEGAGAGTLDAVARTGAPAGLAGFEAGDGASWRRAIEVFIGVFFEGLGALSFTSTRHALRD